MDSISFATFPNAIMFFVSFNVILPILLPRFAQDLVTGFGDQNEIFRMGVLRFLKLCYGTEWSDFEVFQGRCILCPT